MQVFRSVCRKAEKRTDTGTLPELNEKGALFYG